MLDYVHPWPNAAGFYVARDQGWYQETGLEVELTTHDYGRGAAQAALNAYADQVRLELPDFWQPSPGTLNTVQGNLRGYVPNAYGFISPEEWYFTKS